MVIRQPAHHDRLVGTKKVDAQPYLFWAKQHAVHKYPHADNSVIDRIGFMMARQKAILKYRERHHSKLSQGIDPEDGKSTILSETVATDVYDETNHPHDIVSEAGVSETSYGGTLLEGTDEVLETGKENTSEGVEETSQTPLQDNSINVKQRPQDTKTLIETSDSSTHGGDSEEKLWERSGRASILSMPMSNDEQHEGMLYKMARLGASTHSNPKDKQKDQDTKDYLQAETSQISDGVEHFENKDFETLEARSEQRKSVLESETEEAERRRLMIEMKEAGLFKRREAKNQGKREVALEEWEGENAWTRRKKKEEDLWKEREFCEALMGLVYNEQEINAILMKQKEKEMERESRIRARRNIQSQQPLRHNRTKARKNAQMQKALGPRFTASTWCQRH